MKSVLIIIPYDRIYPPMNGGMQRCFHILHQLALHFKVTAIINQDKLLFQKALPFYPALAAVNIYSTRNQKQTLDMVSILPPRIKNALRYRWYKRTLKATTDGNFLMYYPLLKRMLKKNSYDAVILENLDTLNAVDIIRRFDKKTKIIYDTLNVGYRLAEQEVKKGMMKTGQMQGILETEKNFYKNLDAIFTCSNIELADFKTINKGYLHGAVIPNGVELFPQLFDTGVSSDYPEYIIFCGSLFYEPNAEGLAWFCNKIWPAVKQSFPSLKLLVVGSGNLAAQSEAKEQDNNWIFTGTVADVKPFYNQAAVAIVPLKSGSGTRLKILEAMGLGVPVISTAKGAEGIDYTDCRDIIIADEENNFADSIIQLLHNRERRLEIQAAAIKLVKSKYDWHIIGNQMSTFLNSLVDKNGSEKYPGE